MASILNHPSLGKIQGKLHDGVLQFLGIRYATLKDRFAEPLLANGTGQADEVLDATRYGPMVASNPEACGFEQQGLIQHTLPFDPFEISDIDGLNLSVSIPSPSDAKIKPGAALPVLVFIHGGGFGIGSHSWPQVDLARFVKLSAEKGSPFIGVGINYRLGAPGFLTSSEMRAAGYRSNNGLWDQRTALLWVRKHIGGFGGDAQNITVLGQSAGGASATLHLYSREALFDQLIILGGTHLLFSPLPPPVQEHIYASVVQSLDLGALSAEERLNALKALPVEELYTRFGLNLPLIPVTDGQLVPDPVATFQDMSSKDERIEKMMPGRRWCKKLLIGDCTYDGVVFHAMLAHKKSGAAKTICGAIRKSLSDHPEEAEALLAAYGVTTDMPDDAAFQAITLFGNDITFHTPTLHMAKGWPGEAYVFHFNSPNPWEGPSKGIAGHVLDLAFLFQNFNEFLPVDQRKIAETFASQMTDFINHRAPFPAYDPAKGGVMVYGPPAEGVGFMRTNDPERLGRRNSLEPIASRVGFDRIVRAWLDFMSGS